ncbi:MAG TPA: carboxypeptidase-like regulatory domain-containing protein [Bacteroidetes bacterium]|nr:carboxypeptidase-like regulatory domain-containing protein [Bacteroidota bacterium]
MHFHKNKNWLYTGLLFLFLASNVFSQKMTTVKGTVIDAGTKEPLIFVNVAFTGTNIGTETDIDGKFQLDSKYASGSITLSYVGYKTQTIAIEKNTRQKITVKLVSNAIELKTATVTGKKRKRIKNKDNPAVAIMKKAIKNKGNNRIEGQSFYEYDKYEKVQFDLNNFNPEKMRKRRAFKKFQFIFDYVDTSALNGKPFLPFFIQEISSKVYYRKSPESHKEYRNAVKVTSLEEYMDIDDLTTMMDVMYRDINIYGNNVELLGLAFMTPLNPLAPTFYNFYLTDSMAVVNGHDSYEISFFPRNKKNLAFKGKMYIQKGTYAVIKADLGMVKAANLNFVQDLKIVQEFEEKNGVWVLTKDKVVLDFGAFKKGVGIFGNRDVSYKNFVFGKPREDKIYSGAEKVVLVDGAKEKDEADWQSIRHDTLNQTERGVYEMIDTLQNAPAFKTVMTIMKLAFAGYKTAGKFDIGHIANFYSWNPVEGWRLKFGGETNLKFNPKLQLKSYLAYGTRDKNWKYSATLKYSFKDDYLSNPKHFFEVRYRHDVNLVGQLLRYSSSDSFFLSFQRGNRSRMFSFDKYSARYFLEFDNHISIDATYTNTTQRPVGTMVLGFTDELGEPATLPEIQKSELEMAFRFAPNEQYVQGHNYRFPFFNKYPVFTLRLAAGMKGVLGGDYNYGSASLNVFKRFYMSLLGNLRFEAEAGKYFGKGLPYFMLHLPRADQSFGYRTGAFNMMNYQEFVSDEYVTVSIEHYFKGFFFNRVPLLRRLKLRELITFKGIYGRLTDKNNPNKNAGLIQFVREADGSPVTYTLDDKPYMEVSVGVSNIFKVVRIDLLRRLTYLEGHPNIPNLFGVKGMGIRGKLVFEF